MLKAATASSPACQPVCWMRGSTTSTEAIWPKEADMPVTWLSSGTRPGRNQRGSSRRTALKMHASPMPSRMRAA